MLPNATHSSIEGILQDNSGALIKRMRIELPICISYALHFVEIEARTVLARAYPRVDTSRQYYI